MLRDPVFRAHSRFVEQVQFGTLNATLPTQPRGYAALANTTSFVQYVDWVLTHMEACLQRAQLKPPALARHLTMQCYLWDHVIGYSVYDIFLLNYLEHFPDKQVLVVYMEDLAAEPLRILEQVEAHIGVPHHQYNTTELAAAFNARGSYGWGRGSMLSDRKGSIEPSGVDQNATAVLEAVERLRRFFAPSVQRLFALADEGRITRAPQAWRARYGSAAFSKDAPPATPQNASAV
ncbi:hypothetical protein HYH03_009878 [Edaphochlamys debaryana]|uniref:Sulfotransferase n=1 Tax=Edaphochlamys debaryana TaxID=47281 RepID=A0A835XXJ5_9CHLO|nr:hypothetical protein HYH03_009878 [Edaphochlamys debaryana]|eukprot:KAG2491715.1 hypothetical protein HYH03_009878 [Edaphochlamys debaryana]